MQDQQKVTESLIDFIVGLSYVDLPREVVHETKRQLLDTLSCMVGGHSLERSRILVNMVKKFRGKKESYIFPTGDRLPCVNSAFLNAELGNSLDLEETFYNFHHFASPNIAVALSIGEREEVNGKELITAISIGYEIDARLALAIQVLRQLNGDFHYSPGYGAGFQVFGAVSVASKLLGLNKEQIANAFGLAGISAPVPAMIKAFRENPQPMSKYAPYGLIAKNGIMAALLAQEGFTSIKTILDGDVGFWRMTSGEKCNWAVLTEGLGRKWWILETAYKFYPTCRYLHGGLDCLKTIIHDNRLNASKIDEINIVIPFPVSANFEAFNIKDEMGIQMSGRYVFAATVFGINPTDWYSPEIMKDRKIGNFMGKIKITSSSENNRRMNNYTRDSKYMGYNFFPMTVQVRSGKQVYTQSTDYAKGDPWSHETKASDSELENKFNEWTRKFLDTQKRKRAIEYIWELENLKNVKELSRHLISSQTN